MAMPTTNVKHALRDKETREEARKQLLRDDPSAIDEDTDVIEEWIDDIIHEWAEEYSRETDIGFDPS